MTGRVDDQGEPTQLWDPPTPPRSRRSPRRASVVLVIALVLSLVANAVLAASWWNAHDRADRREEQVARLRSRVDDLEKRTDQGGPGGNSLDDLFGRLFGDDGPGNDDLDQMLRDLLGGDQGLGDLFGGLGGASCLGSLTGGMSGDQADIPDDDLRSQYDATARWVEQHRGLQFDEVPEPTFVTPEEMSRRVAAEVRRTYDEHDAALDAQLLAALGAIEPGTDLLEMQTDFTAGQVAGYYDPRTGELVVATDDPSEPLDTNGLTALAHELDHALTDQALGLPIDEDAPAAASDEQLAATALVEGDATLVMTKFAMSAISLEDQLSMGLDPELGDALEALARTPHFLTAEMEFPYEEGLGLACALDADGGWKAVDQAYDDPPTTSAQVLFPERYTAHERAADPSDPGSPGDGWKRERRSSFGAAELLWLFEAPGDDTGAAIDDARDRVAAWNGGEAVQWTHGDDVAVGISLREREGEPDLCDSVREWYHAAFPMARADESGGGVSFEDGRQAARLSCPGNEVRLGIAPDLDAAARIAG